MNVYLSEVICASTLADFVHSHTLNFQKKSDKLESQEKEWRASAALPLYSTINNHLSISCNTFDIAIKC